MKTRIWLLLSLLALGSCIYDDEPECCRPSKIAVEMDIRPAPLANAMRTSDDTSIRDVNLCLYDEEGAVVLHRFLTSSRLRFDCFPGRYRLRLAANLGRDVGAAPDTVSLAGTERYEVLPMTYEGDVTITASAQGVVALPPIEVTRAVAKVSCAIAVQPEDMELLSAQLVCVPRAASLFEGSAPPSDAAEDYIDGEVLPLGGRAAEVEYYLLPNLQGENSAIADQRQKNAANAPAHASYLRLRALRGDRVLTYSVYLGENNTSNFDVGANRHYRLQISVLGDKDIDIRMSAYTVRVWDDFDDYAYGGYCFLDGTRYLHIDVECYDGTAPESGHLELLAGAPDSFTFNYGDTGASHDFDIYDCTGDNEYEMEYYRPGYGDDDALLKYRVSLTDVYGFTRSYDFEHRMANAVYVETTGAGTISAVEAQHVEPRPGGREDCTLVLFAAPSVRLTAAAAPGMVFEGWYSDDRHEHLVSAEPEYLYKAQAPLRYLYALFRPGERVLDADGTANCYIAPELGQSYSFDATTMGNGRATHNIAPRPLAGTSARLIWESGTRANAVIASVELVAGRIRLKTGTQYGNALVGLYDSRGECLWSWHIWVADYLPDAVAQTYASGARFMDRNLGALGTDYSDIAACGLYYQWGRKDPFPHPASYSSTAPAPFVYHDGYAHTSIHPERYDASKIMTLDWAAGHPTTFIHAADYDIDRNEEDILDWLRTPHHNLWGNPTDGAAVFSRDVSKSIYDPCPPGWRVPDAWDFGGISYARQQLPYYVDIVCNGTRTARYPACGTFDGEGFSDVGAYAQLFTAAPYFWVFAQQNSFFDAVACTSMRLTTVPVSISDMRFRANTLRCIKE